MTDLSDQTESTASPAGAFRIPDFRKLWSNNVCYFMAMNALRFVFSWYVLDGLGLGEREQGYVVFALGIPSVFLILQAGVWADRVDQRKLLIGTQLGAAAVMAGTAALIATDRATLTAVMVVAVLAGAAMTVGQPVRASLIPALVPRSQLFGAIALNALAMTSSMILGPVIARAVGAGFDFDGVFAFLAILLTAGVGLVWTLRVPTADGPAPERRSIRAETMDALGHVVGDRALRSLFLLLSVSGLTINPAVMITLQAFVKEELGRDSGDAAILFALMGVGLAISSVVVMRKGDMANKGAAFQRAMMVGGTMTCLMGFTTSFVQLMPLVFVMGLAGGFYINMNQGLIQANTPQPMMGRVMGLFSLVQLGFMPIGALLLGLIANGIGIGTTMSAVAAIALVVVVITYTTERELRTLA
ncbi:MAG: MFS transporter [Actinomycetota bacterium]